MLKNIAVRGKKDIIAVFSKIAEMSGKQDTGRKQAVLDIIHYVAGMPLNEATKVELKAASKQRIDESNIDDVSVPASIKISIDIEEAIWTKAMDVFKYVFDLKGNPQMPYFLKVGGNAYIKELENQNVKLGVAEVKTTDKSSSMMSIESFKDLSTDDKLAEIYRLLAERGV